MLGTDAEMETNVEYEATWATNQPDWQAQRKVFAKHPEPTGFLLGHGDYVITEADRPVDLNAVSILLHRWLGAVDVPNNEVDDEVGQLTLTDHAMIQLIEKTRDCIRDIDYTINPIYSWLPSKNNSSNSPTTTKTHSSNSSTT